MIKLPDETEMKWRDLALQFDGHRMQAISLLKMIIKDASDDQYLSVRNFLKSGPLPGEEVLRNRIAEIAEAQRLNATAQPVSDGWVKCSERMPPVKTAIIVGKWNGRLWATKWATYIPSHPEANSFGYIMPGGSWEPDFWMKVPAAPGGQDG